MQEWDAPDNKNSIRNNLARKCEECGIISSCVSDEGFEDHTDQKAELCHHCYCSITGSDECMDQVSEGASMCEDCTHMLDVIESMGCEEFESCEFCPNTGDCDHPGSK